jgi:sugar O-acyltransferase (sialic acid O-acetyltransferase NeuD family)
VTKPLIILGGGGHAAVLAETLSLLQRPALGFTDVQAPADAGWLDYLGDDATMQATYTAGEVTLINGVGSNGAITRRAELFEECIAAHYSFGDVIHPSAWLSPSATHAQGLQILAGAVVNTRAQLGNNVLINSHAVVEHHCTVGDHCHIASGAVVCGDCHIGRAVHIGAGAVINPGTSIGDGAVIASGAVVIADVTAGYLMAGVPAQAKNQGKQWVSHNSKEI